MSITCGGYRRTISVLLLLIINQTIIKQYYNAGLKHKVFDLIYTNNIYTIMKFEFHISSLSDDVTTSVLSSFE